MNERDAVISILNQIECQRKYGCKGKGQHNEWILKKRSINIAADDMCCNCDRGVYL